MHNIEFKNKYSKYFVGKTFPQFVEQILLQESKHAKYVAMNRYLKINNKISLQEIIREACNNLIYSASGKSASIFINPSIINRKTNMKLIDLIDLVDYGNLEIRGTSLFREAFQFCGDNIGTFFLMTAAAKTKKTEGDAK